MEFMGPIDRDANPRELAPSEVVGMRFVEVPMDVFYWICSRVEEHQIFSRDYSFPFVAIELISGLVMFIGKD